MSGTSLLHLISFVIGIIAATGDSIVENSIYLNEQINLSQCSDNGYCFADDHDQVTWFGTKSAYPITTSDQNDDQFQIPSKYEIILE